MMGRLVVMVPYFNYMDLNITTITLIYVINV